MDDVAKLECDAPLVGIDEDMRIARLNPPSERLLRISARDAIGRPCHEVFQGRDTRGRPFCRPDCPVRSARARRELVAPFELHVDRGAAETIRVSFIPIFQNDVHHYLLSEVTGTSDRSGRAHDPALELTKREHEVLTLLTRGRGTNDIARELFISPATVRNHIRHILTKLDVHSRIEAVAVARERGLLADRR